MTFCSTLWSDLISLTPHEPPSSPGVHWNQIPAIFSEVVIMAGSFKPKHERRKITSNDIVRANTIVLEAARCILGSRAGSLSTIHLLCMQFYLGDESVFIGQTVANTIATQKVASVEFTIMTKVRKNCSVDELLTYGRQFMSFFGSCPNTFGGLARLTLENLRLGESDFPKIFSICNQLEFLRLQQCDAGNLSLLEFLRLQQLRELLIFCSSIKRVDLKCVPKLTILKFNAFLSPDDPFCLGYVPLLQSVTIINTGLSWHKMLKLSELLGKTAISILHLKFKCEKVSGGPHCCQSVVCRGEVVVIIFGKHNYALSPSFADLGKPEGRKQLLPVFHKLRLVNLINISEECDLTWTMFILQGALALKALCIMVRDHLCEMTTGEVRKMFAFSEKKDKGLEWEPSTPDFKHHNLAELRIYGFQVEDKFVRYARNVMEAALNLEAMNLYKNPGCDKCKHTLPNHWTWTEMLLIRDKINKGMSSHARIHFPKAC